MAIKTAAAPSTTPGTIAGVMDMLIGQADIALDQGCGNVPFASKAKSAMAGNDGFNARKFLPPWFATARTAPCPAPWLPSRFTTGIRCYRRNPAHGTAARPAAFQAQ